MATSLRRCTSPEHIQKPTAKSSKRRHHYGRPESRPRRPQCEDIHTCFRCHSSTHPPHNTRSSLTRQLRPHSQRYPSPVSMTGPPASASAPSLTIPHEMAGITMERTPSGNSIIDTPLSYFSHLDHNTLAHADLEAARRVENHVFNSRRHSPCSTRSPKNHERILRGLIGRVDVLDDSSLDGILTTADTLFFDGVLSTRVRWEWSSLDRYRDELVGTTALRPCVHREGFETLIVLSEPILKDPRYDRRLLLSAFLHELIHCYLFISCGFEARMQGGHTEGFHRIAQIIDRVIDGWVGDGYLSLCNMKANLDQFRRNDDESRWDGSWFEGARDHQNRSDHHCWRHYEHVQEEE